jgi:uncharacterized membrane protein YsdA (DUF1294 family)
MFYLLVYLAIINVVSFVFMLADKIKAKKNRWRTPERTLLGICAIGGSLGGYIAMQLFSHKTKHPQFSIGIPVMLVLHIVLVVVLYILF